ncbi:MAG: cob(I)yrinic acid a,c-diamide adenosyltransferase [Desulfobacterales bacterium]
MKGYVQIYTGEGKGKTTAALGLAIRAAGAGLKVFIGQFIKTGDYSEIKALKERFSDVIVIEQFGAGGFIRSKPLPEHIRAASKGLERIREIMASGQYQIIICEEANVAVSMGLIGVDDLLDLIAKKPENVEMVFTGRNADPRLLEAADLVTEMREIKHYFSKGVKARVGIEK